MNNTTAESEQAEWKPVHRGLLMLSASCIAWTIGANGVILICFYRNRHKSWMSFTRLTFSMVVSDLFVGVNAVPFIVREAEKGLMYVPVCATSIYSTFSVQIVSLFHVLGICIMRSIKLQNANIIGNENLEKKYTKKIIFVSWLFPSFVIMIPFVLWGTISSEKIICRADVVFGTNAVKFKTFIRSFYFMVQCSTNIIYFTSVLKLWLNSRKRVTPVSMEMANNQVNSSNPRTSNAASSTQEYVSSTVIVRQKQAAVTIGLLLILFNVFTLPTTMTLFFSGDVRDVNHTLIFLVSHLFIVNSGLNAIVYATRVSTIRQSAKELFEDVMKMLRLRR